MTVFALAPETETRNDLTSTPSLGNRDRASINKRARSHAVAAVAEAFGIAYV